MNQKVFTAVMIVEYLAALLSMGLLFSDMGAIIYPISTALFAAVLAPFYLRMRKTEDESKKKKLRRTMLLLLLIPTVVAIVMATVLIIALMRYFG